MNAPENFSRIIFGLKYDVQTAVLIADDEFWDGNNMERNGRNTFLYRTPNGRYFTVQLTQWQGEFDALIPVSPEQARSMFEGPLSEHHVEYADAFPGVEIVAA